MESSGRLSYFFRKHSFVRAFSLIILLVLIFLSIFLINHKKTIVPEIDAIIPPVGSPGDIVLIKGKNFGEEKDMSYVSFSGAKLTSSSYVSWSDTAIKIVIPANVQDGLVIVGTKEAQSKPALFANEVDIPVLVPSVVQEIMPTISGISSSKVAVGEKLTIYGNNFGETRNNSRVLFTIDYANIIKNADFVNKKLITDNLVEVSAEEFGYEYWSNTEIQVRVPTGAYTGVVIVENEKKRSEPYAVEIETIAGDREYKNKKVYVVQYSADVKDVNTDDLATITFRAPIPIKMHSQNSVEVSELSRAPLIQNYQNCMVYQINVEKNDVYKNEITQSFVLPVYEIRTNVVPNKISSMKSLTKSFYSQNTKSDPLVPVDTEELIALYKKIVGKETNNYNRAKLIYEYMLKNFTYVNKSKRSNTNILDSIKKEKGDAYDLAVIYAALLRTAGIPCLVDSGVLIEENLGTRNHWWNEFYIPGVGWIPVDVSMSCGIDYELWGSPIEKETYYFGCLDSHRITFSRGFTQMKPFSQENKTVMYQKSFALQSIWEEASSNTNKYSSYWSVPKINGLY